MPLSQWWPEDALGKSERKQEHKKGSFGWNSKFCGVMEAEYQDGLEKFVGELSSSY